MSGNLKPKANIESATAEHSAHRSFESFLPSGGNPLPAGKNWFYSYFFFTRDWPG
jgi:hypothetical protein